MRPLFFLIVFGIFIACQDNEEPNSKKDNYDRAAMLTYWADSLIVPAYKAYSSSLNELQNKATEYTTSPSTDKLQALRASFKMAYKHWQRVAMFEVGKAEEIKLIGHSNTFPADSAEIIKNINENLRVEDVKLYDQQGFPALDLLLHGLEKEDNNTNERLRTDQYKAYLTGLISRLNSLSQTVLTHWEGVGREAFVEKIGNSATSSTNGMVNAYIFYYEKHLRAGKIGIPSGVYSGGVLYPEKVESYYGGYSKELLKEAVLAAQGFFNGKGRSLEMSHSSLKGYLDKLQASKGGKLISEIINENFQKILQQIDAMSSNLSLQLKDNKTAMLQLFDLLQENVILFKIDMLKAIGVNVDYVDADGD